MVEYDSGENAAEKSANRSECWTTFDESEASTAVERYQPMKRLLSGSDAGFLRTSGLDARSIRRFRKQRRTIYWQFVDAFRTESLAAFRARKECMLRQDNCDFPALLRQRYEISVIVLKLRYAGVCHLLHAPVDTARLIAATIDTGCSFLDAQPAASY